MRDRIGKDSLSYGYWLLVLGLGLRWVARRHGASGGCEATVAAEQSLSDGVAEASEQVRPASDMLTNKTA